MRSSAASLGFDEVTNILECPTTPLVTIENIQRNTLDRFFFFQERRP
jgi:hypothetical protein